MPAATTHVTPRARRNAIVTTIGIDPHKTTHTAVAVDGSEIVLAELTIDADKNQTHKLLDWAQSVNGDARVWAVESATGLGRLLSQQLVARGETVVDVPPVLAARVRVLSSGRSDKNDNNDARSVAIAALNTDRLAVVEREDQRQVVRMVAKRHLELTALRTQAACRLHATLAALKPGGARNRLSAKQASRMLQGLRGLDPVGEQRRQVAKTHIADVRRLDREITKSKTEIRRAVEAADTSVTDIFGVGPIIAAFLVGYGPPITQFPTADKYASYNGTAPIEVSSAGKGKHRLSRRGNRTLNHAIHMAAVTQISHNSEGRIYYDKKLGEGKTKKEALRALKRRISNVVYRHLKADAQRHNG